MYGFEFRFEMSKKFDSKFKVRVWFENFGFLKMCLNTVGSGFLLRFWVGFCVCDYLPILCNKHNI